MSKLLFIRNDDVWNLDESFRSFFGFMLAYEIPIVYGVIPAMLKKDAALFLCRAKKRNPKLLDIVQHGYAHLNHAPQGEHKYEFGYSRTYDQQLEDISRGMKIMHRSFGEFLTPGFVPSYHAYDTNTIRALVKLDIPLLSARLKVPYKEKKFLDVPAQIWAHRVSEKGIPSPLNFHGLSRDLASVIESGPISGLVFRHHMITGSKDMDVIKALIQMIRRERTIGKIRMVLFSDLLNAAGITNEK